MQKLLKTVEKLQQENAAVVQRAGQAGGGAITKVANQITRGIEKAGADAQRTRERSEDKQFATEQRELNARLQSDAQRDAATLGAAMNQSRQMTITGIKMHEKRQQDFRADLQGFQTRFLEQVRNGDFQGSEGLAYIKKTEALLRAGIIMGDDMFGDPHVEAYTNAENDRLSRFTAGEDPMSVLKGSLDPLRQPFEKRQPRPNGASEGVVSNFKDPQEAYEWQERRGYPKNGMFFPPEGGFPGGVKPNLAHPGTMFKLMQLDSDMMGMRTEKARQDFLDQHAKKTMETHDVLMRHVEVGDSFNKVYNLKAPQALEAAIEDYAVNPDVTRHMDPSKYLFARTLTHFLGGGPAGEKAAAVGLQFVTGEKEPMTNDDFVIVQSLEAMSFAMMQHSRQELNDLGTTRGGGLAGKFVQEMSNRFGDDRTLVALGVDPDSKAPWVNAQSVIIDRLNDIHSYAQAVNTKMKNESVMTQYNDALAIDARMMDIHYNRKTKDGEQRLARLDELTEELYRTPQEGGLTLTDLQQPGLVGGPAGPPAPDRFRQKTSMVGSFLDMAEQNGSAEDIAAIFLNRFEERGSPNIQAMLKRIEKERQRSGFGKSGQDLVMGAWNANQESRKRSPAEDKALGKIVQEKGAGAGLRAAPPKVVSATMGAAAVVGGFLVQGAATGVRGQVVGEQVRKSFDRGAQNLRGNLGQLGQGVLGEPDRDVVGLNPERNEGN